MPEPGKGESLSQLLHDLWLMRPLEKRQLSIGSDSEKHALSWMPAFAAKRGGNWKLARCGAFGLVTRRGSEDLATSVDGALFLADPDNKVAQGAAEIKARSAFGAIDQIRAARRGKGRWVDAPPSDDGSQLAAAAPNRGHRQPLLHHAAVTDAELMLCVEATRLGIECAALPLVVAHFDEELRASCKRGALDPINESFAQPIVSSLRP